MTVRPTREEAVLALVGLGWVAGWLWPQPLAAVLVAGGCGLGLAMSRRRPELAAAVVLGTGLLAAALGVSSENPGTLFPAAVVVFGLGRWSGRWAAILGLLGFLAPLGRADPPSIPATLVFGAVLYGCFWGFGRVVATKGARAEAARQRAARIGGQDPRTVAEAVVAEERARLASDIGQVVGESVASMVSDAELAGRELDPVVIERIRLRGASAVAELRRMLGLLRQPHESVAPEAPRRRSRSWTSYALPGALVLTAGAIGLITVLHPAPFSVLIAPVIVVLSWWTGVDGRRVTWLSWLSLVVTSAVVALLLEPENAAMQLVVIVLPTWAGHAWSDNNRAQRSAQQATTQAQSELDRAVAEAVRQERLRVARDLHDVTSHALGVMVLQAGAANAQRLADPVRARVSLALVAEVGSRALGDLDRLVGLIDAGVLGVVATDEPTDLSARIAALVDRIRQTGTKVALQVRRSPTDPGTAQVVYRVVQEALTNAVRYAPGSTVEVLVEGADTGCRISVVDDGGHRSGEAVDAPPGSVNRQGTGFGLLGAAERVWALDGEFTAGPELGGRCQTTTYCAAPEHAPDCVVVVADRTPLSDSSDALSGTHPGTCSLRPPFNTTLPAGGWAVRAWIPARAEAAQVPAGAAP